MMRDLLSLTGTIRDQPTGTWMHPAIQWLDPSVQADALSSGLIPLLIRFGFTPESGKEYSAVQKVLDGQRIAEPEVKTLAHENFVLKNPLGGREAARQEVQLSALVGPAGILVFLLAGLIARAIVLIYDSLLSQLRHSEPRRGVPMGTIPASSINSKESRIEGSRWSEILRPAGLRMTKKTHTRRYLIMTQPPRGCSKNNLTLRSLKNSSTAA
jgi:hypothetical protein